MYVHERGSEMGLSFLLGKMKKRYRNIPQAIQVFATIFAPKKTKYIVNNMQVIDNKNSARWGFEYLLDLFVSVLNNKVRSCGENILAKAISYGRTEKEAEEDIRQVVKLYDAIVIFLKKAVNQ